MTRQSSFKDRVRARMSEKGERYTDARDRISEKHDRVEAARARLSSTADRPSDESVAAATGKPWDAWFSALDEWGARDRRHPETVVYLVDQHGVPGWWAQSITIAYHRARGMRLKHQQADGFTVWASKTISVPVAAAVDAFVDDQTRERWLTDGVMSLRTAQGGGTGRSGRTGPSGRTARFDWGDGRTRVLVTFDEKGDGKVSVSVAHERLPDPDEAETAKSAWRERLGRLKSFLEG